MVKQIEREMESQRDERFVEADGAWDGVSEEMRRTLDMSPLQLYQM